MIICEVMLNPGIIVEELSKRLKMKEKTLKNRLGELRGEGLIARRGRRGGVYLTPWGEVLAKSISEA